MTSPTMQEVDKAIGASPKPIDSLVFFGHGGQQDRHRNSSNQLNEDKETHKIDLLAGDKSTISNMEKLYSASGKPKNILMASCFGGAVGDDVAKHSNKFEADTNILVSGSSKHPTFGKGPTTRYKEASTKGPVNLTDFPAKKAVEDAETVNLHRIAKDAEGKNHTISTKLIAPKTADGIAQLDSPESAKKFFESEADYKQGSKKHQESHAVYKIDGKDPQEILKKNPSLQKAFEDMKKEVKASTAKATQSLDQGKLQKYKQNLLLKAAINGNDKVINAMTKVDKSKPPEKRELASMINQADSSGSMPLHEASGHSKPNISNVINALHKAGADPNKPDHEGNTPLHQAVSNSNSDTPNAINALKNAGADPNKQNNHGNTPLHMAALTGKADIVSALIKNGADPNIKNNLRRKPIDYAPEANKEDIKKAMIPPAPDAIASNPNSQDKDGRTPLHEAAASGNINSINALISRGAKPDVPDKYGNTPMHEAAAFGTADAINALKAGGANVDAQNIRGDTPMHEAAVEGKVDAINALDKAGARVDATNIHGRTPLDYAKKEGAQEAVKALDDAQKRKESAAAVPTPTASAATPPTRPNAPGSTEKPAQDTQQPSSTPAQKAPTPPPVSDAPPKTAPSRTDSPAPPTSSTPSTDMSKTPPSPVAATKTAPSRTDSPAPPTSSIVN